MSSESLPVATEYALLRTAGPFVSDDIREAIALVVTQWRVQRGGPDGRRLQLDNLLGGNVQFSADFFGRRFAPQFLFQLRRRAADVEQLVRGVNRDADRLGLVGERAADGLLNPPGGVGGKLRALVGIEFFDRAHQADVAFVDQVEQGQPVVFVVTGNLHNQAKVRLDHVLSGLGVAFVDAPGELDLLLRGQQLRLADFTDVAGPGCARNRSQPNRPAAPFAPHSANRCRSPSSNRGGAASAISMNWPVCAAAR